MVEVGLARLRHQTWSRSGLPDFATKHGRSRIVPTSAGEGWGEAPPAFPWRAYAFVHAKNVEAPRLQAAVFRILQCVPVTIFERVWYFCTSVLREYTRK